MDKLKIFLANAKKYQFWMCCGVMLLTSLGCWWWACGDLSESVQKTLNGDRMRFHVGPPSSPCSQPERHRLNHED